jgi:hypothetical protein
VVIPRLDDSALDELGELEEEHAGPTAETGKLAEAEK